MVILWVPFPENIYGWILAYLSDRLRWSIEDILIIRSRQYGNWKLDDHIYGLYKKNLKFAAWLFYEIYYSIYFWKLFTLFCFFRCIYHSSLFWSRLVIFLFLFLISTQKFQTFNRIRKLSVKFSRYLAWEQTRLDEIRQRIKC